MAEKMAKSFPTTKCVNEKLQRQLLAHRNASWPILRLATHGIIHQLEFTAASIHDVAPNYCDGRYTDLYHLEDSINLVKDKLEAVMLAELTSLDALEDELAK
jgi:hypothetical protein